MHTCAYTYYFWWENHWSLPNHSRMYGKQFSCVPLYSFKPFQIQEILWPGAWNHLKEQQCLPGELDQNMGMEYSPSLSGTALSEKSDFTPWPLTNNYSVQILWFQEWSLWRTEGAWGVKQNVEEVHIPSMRDWGTIVYLVYLFFMKYLYSTTIITFRESSLNVANNGKWFFQDDEWCQPLVL